MCLPIPSHVGRGCPSTSLLAIFLPLFSASAYGFPQALDTNSWEILVPVEPGDVWSCRDGSVHVHRAFLSFEHVAGSGPVLGACWLGDLGWSHCLLES